MAIGCDLTDIYKLDQALAKVFDLQNYELLCIAEVSVTYMEVAAADALIRWASHFPNGICDNRQTSSPREQTADT